MKESSKEIPWANIWMMVFAVVAIWLLWPRPENPAHHRMMWAIVPSAIACPFPSFHPRMTRAYNGVISAGEITSCLSV